MKANNSIKQTLINIMNLAIGDIRDEASKFSKEDKVNYDPNKEDIVTSADKRAQARYVGNLRTHFPHFGIIGEEEDLNIPCIDRENPIYFTVDPLDGTKAFARYQSYGVGTMLALANGNDVWAAYVGDVNTGDIYGYSDEGPVTRTRFGVESEIKVDTAVPLGKLYALFDLPVHRFPKVLQKMGLSVEEGGVFKEASVAGGSIGMLFSRLWIGEVGVLFMKPGFDTPWDSTPIFGINKKLGFKHFKMNPETEEVEVFEPILPKKVSKKGYIEFVAHESKVEEIISFIKSNKA